MTSDEALEVLGYLLGHEKAVDSGEMEDVQNCLNSQEQEALKVILSDFRELKEKKNDVCKWEDDSHHVVCGHGQVEYRHKVRDWSFCPYCGKKVMVNDWSKGKE